MPTGALGIWYADEYEASPRRLIPNAASAEPVSTNLFTAPRRMFNSEFYSSANMVITDNSAVGPDGLTHASTIVGTGTSYLYALGGGAPNLAAGTYTLAVSAKRSAAAGSDQVFTQRFSTAGEISPDRTCTTSWQRFYWTATLSSGVQSILAIFANASLDIDICDLCLYAGTVTDRNEPALGGHLYLGENQLNPEPTVAAGIIDFSAEGFGLMQFPDVTLTEYTVLSVARRVADTKTYNAILSTHGNYTLFSPMHDTDRTASGYFGGGQIDTGLTGSFDLNGRGWKVHARRRTATHNSLFVNGIRFIHDTQSPTPPTIRNLVAGAFHSLSNKTDYEIAAIALYDRALTDEEVVTATAALEARVGLSSLSIDDNDIYLRAEGDSITADTNSYCLLYGANSTVNVLGARSAVPGGTISGLETRAVDLDPMIPATLGNKRFVLSVLIGANDLASVDVAPFLADLESYLDDRRAAGWEVVLCTILPNTISGFNAKRNTANTTMRTWVGTHCDYICDFAAEATMGPDAAASNATYYPDGLHPSLAGHELLEVVYRATINAL